VFRENTEEHKIVERYLFLIISYLILFCWPSTNSYRFRVGIKISKETKTFFMTSDPAARARALSRQIAALSAELDRVLSLPARSRSTSPVSSSPPPSGPIQIGEFVIITNRYGGHFGKRAKVIGEAGQSFDLRLTSTGETFQKRKRNVRRLI